MNLMVCVDDRMGMALHNRRQSKDRVVLERILSRAAGKRLWMTAYSAKQFAENEDICISDRFWEDAGSEDWCFAEQSDPAEYADQIDRLVLYRWNRRYPGDIHCTIPLEEWKLVSSEEFSGFSHEKITEEVYQR